MTGQEGTREKGNIDRTGRHEGERNLGGTGRHEGERNLDRRGRTDNLTGRERKKHEYVFTVILCEIIVHLT